MEYRNYLLPGMVLFSVFVSGCADLSEVRRERLKEEVMGKEYVEKLESLREIDKSKREFDMRGAENYKCGDPSERE